jgi:CHAT domain-containing protein
MIKKIILIAGLFVVILLSYFYFTHSRSRNAVKSSLSENKNDSVVFRQLDKMPSWKKAYSFYKSVSNDSALYYFQKVMIEITVTNKSRKLCQEVSNRIGHVYISKADYKSAKNYFRKALDYAAPITKPDIIDANTFDDIGLLFHFENESDSALYYCNKASKIYAGILGDKSIQVVRCNVQIGDIYRWIRLDYFNAERYYYKALQIFEKQRFDIQNEIYFRILYNLTTTNRLKCDYDKAILYGLRTIQLAETVENYHKYTELCYVILANIYNDKGILGDAILYYNKAIKINKISGNKNNRYLSNYMINLAEAWFQLNDFSKVIQYTDTTKKLLKNQPENYSELSAIYSLLGETYMKLGLSQLALTNANKCLALRRKYLGNKNLLIAEAYDLLGRFYEYKLNLDSALQYYQRALISSVVDFNNLSLKANPIFIQSKTNEPIIGFVTNKASALQKKFIDDPSDTSSIALSMKCYILLDSLVSSSRKSMDTEKSKLTFTVSRHYLYEEAIEDAYLMYQLKKRKQYIQEAFQLFEKNKYLLLLEKLKMAEAANKAGIPDSLAILERNLSAELKFAQDQLSDEQHKINANSSKIQSLNKKVFETVRLIESLHQIFEKEYPNYFQIRYQDRTVCLENVQTYCAKMNMQVLQYFWGKKSVYILGISEDEVNFTKVPNSEELRKNVTGFISLLHEANVISNKKFRDYSDRAIYLYEQIMKPALMTSTLNKNSLKNLTVIPDGPLAKLPFEAFTTSVSSSSKIDYKNLSFLIHQYNIQYAYSSNILLGNSNASHTRYIKKLLGFGYSGQTGSTDRTVRQSLPGTSLEMNTLSKYFKTKLFIGPNASEYNFKKYAAGYDIIHLALHGTANEEQETDTKLVFRKDLDKIDDGLLYSNEIYNLNLEAKLVVLSACETGIGKDYNGEGIFSLARAFSYAGCPSVVISLWKVNDAATSDLMENFYKHLSNEEAIGQSLFEAKQEYLKNADEYNAHPAFWASFVAFGDMSPLKIKHHLILPWIVGLFVILIGVALVFKIKFFRK